MKLLDGIYFSGMHLEAQERLNGNIKMSNENFVSIEESFETQRLCITTLNNLVEQQQKEIDTLTANLLDTVKSLTVFVKAVEMRLQLIEKPPCIMP